MKPTFISYFIYFAPKTGNYRFAPVDQFGNKTPHIIIVNKSLVQSQRVDLTFREEGEVLQINSYTGGRATMVRGKYVAGSGAWAYNFP